MVIKAAVRGKVLFWEALFEERLTCHNLNSSRTSCLVIEFS